MFAKQTLSSASLVIVLVGSSVIAQADPTPGEDDAGEARVPTGRFMIGAGYSSIEGFIARASVAQPDLFRTGHSLSLDATLSARRQLFRLAYSTADLGDGLRLHAELFNERRLLPGFTRQGSGGGLALSQQLSPHLRAFVGYRYEVVRVDEGEALLARGTPNTSPLVDGTISSVRAGLEYSTLDRLDAPLRGTSIGAMYEIADRRLGSDFNFDRVTAWVSHHRPLGPLTLHLSGSLSQIGSRDGSPVPRSERLFLDGARDIRGFSLGDLDPGGPFGTPVGGTTKITARAELEVPLVRKVGLSAVGFLDAGGIAGETGAALGRSVGVGLLWRSPIGPLRFDWALPLDGAGPPRFLFGFGDRW